MPIPPPVATTGADALRANPMFNAPLSMADMSKINEAHAAQIARILKTKLDSSSDIDEYDVSAPANVSEYVLGLRQQRADRILGHAVDADRIGDVLDMPDGVQRKEVSIGEIMASADAQHSAVLQKPWMVREYTNRDNAFAKYTLDLLPGLLCGVAVRCKEFYLLPEQRLAILAMITALPEDVYVNCEIPRDAMEVLTPRGSRKAGFSARYRLEKNKLPTFTIAHYCTGSGKTIMAVMAALSLLCCNMRWNALKSSFRGLLEDRTREEYSGLCKVDNTDDARLARLAIMFVPATTLSHWHKTAESAVFGVKECFGPTTDVRVWRGLGGRDQSMQEALDCGQPVLWILPMESESMAAVRKSPHIHYAVRLFDELNVQMRSRYEQPESMAMYNYITQATVESFETATHNNPRAPLRQAFRGNFAAIRRAPEALVNQEYKAVAEMLEHYCKIKVFAAPDFVRNAVSYAVQGNMPRSIVVHRIHMRSATLAAMATGSGMVNISLSDLAGRLLGDRVEKNVRDRIKSLFSRAEAMCTDALLSDLNEAHDALPLLTMADNQAKQSVKRLVERMTKLFSGTFPTCPVTFAPIPRERVRILPCCTCIFDSETLASWKKSCPVCRAPITAVGEVKPEVKPEVGDAAPGGSSNAEGKRSATSEGKKLLKQQKLQRGSPSLQPVDCADGADGCQAVSGASFGAEAAFEAKLVKIDSENLGSVDGVLQVMQAQVAMDPTSRMLLCFGFETSQRSLVRQISARIEAEIQGAFVLDVEDCAKDYIKMETSLDCFNNRAKYPRPHVFLVNTTSTSSSVQGLDLHVTDLTIVASVCTVVIKRQAVGRSLRMRPLPTGKAEYEFPSKRVVVAKMAF